jgi:hypothetical protein
VSRIKIQHGGVVRCDIPHCNERFTTYSWLVRARAQAKTAGWWRLRGSLIVVDTEGHILASGARKVDLCPAHGAEHATLIAERTAARKAERAAKKAAKAALSLVKAE